MIKEKNSCLKILSVIALFVLMLFSFTACGKDDSAKGANLDKKINEYFNVEYRDLNVKEKDELNSSRYYFAEDKYKNNKTKVFGSVNVSKEVYKDGKKVGYIDIAHRYTFIDDVKTESIEFDTKKYTSMYKFDIPNVISGTFAFYGDESDKILRYLDINLLIGENTYLAKVSITDNKELESAFFQKVYGIAKDQPFDLYSVLSILDENWPKTHAKINTNEDSSTIKYFSQYLRSNVGFASEDENDYVYVYMGIENGEITKSKIKNYEVKGSLYDYIVTGYASFMEDDFVMAFPDFSTYTDKMPELK